MEIYDVVVIGAGPAGAQAAISASHQMRHVLVLDAGGVSRLKGRAYWSKSVMFEDVPVFSGITGPDFIKALRKWMESRPVRDVQIAGVERKAGIEIKGARALEVSRSEDIFDIEASLSPLKGGAPLQIENFFGRTVVVASGFEDIWPDIEVDQTAERLYQRYRTVFRYAGNRKGWHVCIRCDGHLHVDRDIAVVGAGDYIYDVAAGAQDFTDKITILTNGRPHGMSKEVLDTVKGRNIPIIEERIEKHIGMGTDLLGFKLENGKELFFDGFFVDEGLVANAEFLDKWAIRTDEEGLLIVDDDNQVLDSKGSKVEGLFAAGDIVSGTRNLIASAFGSGQNAGLEACDSLRKFD